MNKFRARITFDTEIEAENLREAIYKINYSLSGFDETHNLLISCVREAIPKVAGSETVSGSQSGPEL